MTRKEFIIKNSKNYLYIFIPAEDVHLFPSGIQRKRAEQIKSLAHIAGNTDINSLVTEMNNQLQSEFGLSGFQMVLRLCSGKNVYGNASVGSVPKLGSPVEIDPQTGFPTHIGIGASVYDGPTGGINTTKPTTVVGSDGHIYSSTFDNETKLPIGVFDATEGTQVSSYDSLSNSYEYGVTTDQNQSNVWNWILEAMPWIISLIEWLGSLFGVKKSQEVSAIQSDGWYSPSSNDTSNTITQASSTLPMLLLGGLVIYGLYSSDSKATPPKSKKTTKKKTI